MRETDIGLGHTGDSHRENHQNIFVDEHDHRIISNEAALKNSNIKCFLKSISEKTTSHWPLKCTLDDRVVQLFWEKIAWQWLSICFVDINRKGGKNTGNSTEIWFYSAALLKHIRCWKYHLTYPWQWMCFQKRCSGLRSVTENDDVDDGPIYCIDLMVSFQSLALAT